MKNIKKIAIWIVIGSYVIVSLSFTGSRHNEVVCSSIEVTLLDSSQYRSFGRSNIPEEIRKDNRHLVGMILDSINTGILEESINRNPFIKHAEIYKTMEGILKIEIQQRDPIIRIIDKYNNSFYIDAEGVLMPNAEKQFARALVASGNIEIIGADSLVKNRILVDSILSSEKKDNKNCRINELYVLAKYIDSIPLWKSQIEQIYVTQNGEYELVPKVGNHIIIFGNTDNYKEKFQRLRAFYTNAVKHYNINRYETINLKFKNQVVCTRR